MNLLGIYAFIFIIVWIILGLKLEFKKIGYLKSMGITTAIIILGFLLGIIPTHVGKSGDKAFYTYNIYKTANIYGKGNAYVDVPSGVKRVIVHNGIDKIISCVNYKNLETVKMTDSVIELGENSFSGCEKLSNIKLSNNLKIIGDCAFYHCESLKEIQLPESIEQIGYWAFNGTIIEEITLPNNAVINKSTIYPKEYKTTLDAPSFMNCRELKRVNINLENINYTEIDGVIFNKDKTEIICYPSALDKKSYVIPDTVTELYFDTFIGCSNLKNLTISGNIKTIENSSIMYCENLETIEINEGVEVIEKGAIKDCANLKNIYMPKSVTEISSEFYDVFTQFGETFEKPTIYCFSDSYAEEYAIQYNFKYVMIDE